MSNVYHTDPAINAILSRINDEDRDLFLRATYFVLETHEGGSVMPLESLSDCSLHIGLPDRPSRRYAIEFGELEFGLEALADLRRVFPAAALWLSCQEILAPIMGDNVWIGAVEARASADPNCSICEWAQLAVAIGKARAKGSMVVVTEICCPTVQAIAARI